LIGTGAPQYVYGYDHASNLLSITPNGATQSFAYTSTNSITSGTYDANGSPSVLSGKSYKWDRANRMVHFANTANNTGSTFVYDGLGRLVRVVDTHAGAITADHSYTWCGNVRCLAHDNTQSGSPVSTQYFDQGAIISGTSYYYVKDQLGSVTHLVTSTGSVASQYSYDPYGNRTTVSGTVVSDVGYAGYFYHAVSGLEFTLYRAYDPTHARWLNRDPIGETGGVNLYAYVNADPLDFVDPFGLAAHLNLINANTDSQIALSNWADSYQPAQYNTIVVHGTPNGEFSPNQYGSTRILLEDMVQQLLESKDYDPNLPTQLIACSAGTNADVMQRLANELNAAVLASPETLSANPKPGLPPLARYEYKTFWGQTNYTYKTPTWYTYNPTNLH
jgi:RHS repeat-associated protein